MAAKAATRSKRAHAARHLTGGHTLRVSRIRIENYRSIRSLDFEPGPLCAFVGENNAGKSNLLRAVNVVLGESWPTERTFSDQDFYNFDRTKEIVIEVWLDTACPLKRYSADLEYHGYRLSVSQYRRAVKSKGKSAGDLKLDFVPLDSKGNPLMGPDGPFVRGTRPRWLPLRMTNEIRDACPLVYVDVRRDYARHSPGSRWSVLGRLLADVNEDFLRSDNEVPDGGSGSHPRSEAFRKRINEAFDLLRTDEFLKVEGALRTHALKQVGLDSASGDVRIEFRPFDPLNAYKSLILVLCEGGQEFEASEVGAGYQSSIVVAIFRTYQELARRGAIFAIEEPEVFLHPHRQRFFYSVLGNLARSGNQVFYTTHSSHFVDLLAPESVAIVRRSVADGTTVVTGPDTISSSTDKERMALERAFDAERNELFFAKGVILVEGDTERALYRALFGRHKFDLDEAGISLVEAGGKGDLPVFLRVLEAFRIPFVVIFDEDSPEDPLNTRIFDCLSDRTRAFPQRPRLEAVLGYRPQRGSKVQQALEFLDANPTPAVARLLWGPARRLVSEVRPDLLAKVP